MYICMYMYPHTYIHLVIYILLVARMEANTKMMAQEHREKVLVQEKYNALIDAEKRRIAGQRSVGSQRIIEHEDVSIQTQFASTDVNIVTTITSLEKGELGGLSQIDRRRQFPLAVTLPNNAVKIDNTLSRPVFSKNQSKNIMLQLPCQNC